MADDDLRNKLRSEGTESLFGDFAAPEDLGFSEPERPGAASPRRMAYDTADERPTKRRQSGFMGLTPQQRMILSFFLFLDVSVLGCLCLFAIGAIQPPFLQ